MTKRKGGRQRNRQSEPREDVGTKVVDVVVTFDEQDDLVRTGLNGRAEIRTEKETEGLLIPVGTLFSAEGRDVVYRIRNGVPVRTPVSVGERSDEQVLVLDGLLEGDRISLTDPTRNVERGGKRP